MSEELKNEVFLSLAFRRHSEALKLTEVVFSSRPIFVAADYDHDIF